MRNFTAVLQKTDDGWWAVTCLEIPGAISQGKTREEALANIEDAIRELLSYRRKKISTENIEEANLSFAV